MVEVRDQHGVLIVDEVDGHIQGNTVFKRVVLYLSSSAVDDVKGDIGPVEAGQHCKVRKIYVFEEDFFSIEEWDMRSLIASKGGSYLNDVF